MNLWLFDLDGVLIRPGGYRAALKITVDAFSRQFGLGESSLSDADIDVFEAFGITSEWDSSAICTAAMIYRIWQAGALLPPPPWVDFETEFPVVGEEALPPMNFGAIARRIGALAPEGENPAGSALEFFLADARREMPGHASLEVLEAWLRLFLGTTRDFALSPTIRIFQSLALGTDNYLVTYHAAPALPSPSLLEQLDRPNLLQASLRRLRNDISSGLIGAAVCTSRPTRPLTLPDARADNSPEAEISLAALDLDLPIAGYGQMRWLADRYGKRPDAYLKPSPAHALAAMFLAAGMAEAEALEMARAVAEEGDVQPALDTFGGEGTSIHLFEDTPTGVRSTQQAVRILGRRGLEIDLNIVGVTTSAEKRKALEGLGATVFPSTDEAVAHARSEIAGSV